MTSMAHAKTPRGKDELLLFMDYDGVAHHENVWWHPRRGPYIKAAPEFTLFQHAQLLVDALAPYPSVLIVLSTSWVLQYSFSEAARRLPPSLRERVIGATFHSEMNEGAFLAKPRGQQVWTDVQRRQPLDWLALDDDPEGWPDSVRQKLVLTDGELGVSAPDVLAELRMKLERMCIGGAPT